MVLSRCAYPEVGTNSSISRSFVISSESKFPRNLNWFKLSLGFLWLLEPFTLRFYVLVCDHLKIWFNSSLLLWGGLLLLIFWTTFGKVPIFMTNMTLEKNLFIIYKMCWWLHPSILICRASQVASLDPPPHIFSHKRIHFLLTMLGQCIYPSHSQYL